jgi:hypothetical protein
VFFAALVRVSLMMRATGGTSVWVMSATAPVAPAQPQPAQQLGTGRVLQLLFGSLGVLAALAFIAGAGALTWALDTQRDGNGYFTTVTHRLHTSSYALASRSLRVDTEWPSWALGDHFARVRITATSTDAARPVFLGIARTDDVNRYLAGVEHEQIVHLDTQPFTVDSFRVSGGAPAGRPAAQSFWRVHASGTGVQTIAWPIERGQWSAVAMNADGGRQVSVDAVFGARVPFLWWIVAGLFVLGGLSSFGGGALIYAGARARAPQRKEA